MRLLTLLICVIGFNCSVAQAAPQSAQASKYEPKAPENVMRGDTADISESITENILARIDSRVVQEIERAWRLVGAGADAKEAVLPPFRMLDGSIRARPAGVTNEHKSFTLKWHPSAIAILHTHPNSVNPLPSGPDRRFADKLQVPIFTVSIRGMFVYDPHTKTMSQIQNGLDWLDLSKWKSVFAQTEGPQEKEISRVESWFKGKSLDGISSTLASSRPEAVKSSDKALLTKDLPLLTDDNRVEDKREIRVLHARLEKTLKFFERDQVVDVIIFRHAQPIVYSKPGVVILISTEVLKIVRDDDDALVGVVAHELAHEYVALEFLKALQSGNLSRMRELELFCDAVAVVAMLQLGFDPARFARAVKMIAERSEKSAELNGGENSHPAVEARLRVMSYVSATLKPTQSRNAVQ